MKKPVLNKRVKVKGVTYHYRAVGGVLISLPQAVSP